MKVLLVAAVLVSLAAASPLGPADARRLLPALQHEEVHDKFGQYALRYVTAEGTVVSERGRLVLSPHGTLVLVVDGQTSYVAPDGKTYATKFSAGLDGVKVEGDHLPIAPEPIPV